MWTIMCLLLLGALEEVSTKPLTLDQALVVFRAQGFDLLLARAEAQAAAADAVMARALSNPEVSYQMSHVGRPYRASLCPEGQCSTTGLMVNLTDQAGLLDVATGKHHLRARASQLLADASWHDFKDAQRHLEAALKAQFLAVALDQSELEFSVQASHSYMEGQKLFAERYLQGDISDADLTRVELETLQAQQREDKARAALDDDLAQLGFLMGYAPGTVPLGVVAPRVDGGPSEQLIALGEGQMLAWAKANRPDIMATRERQDSAKQALRLRLRGRLPDIALNLNYQQLGTGQNAVQPRTYTAGLTLQLPVLYQQQGEIMRARVALQMADVHQDRAMAQLHSDVHRAHTSLKYAHARVQRSANQLLVRAQKARDLVRLQYTKGAASLLDLLDAQRTYNLVNLDHLATLGDYWNAVIGVEQALGIEVQL